MIQKLPTEEIVLPLPWTIDEKNDACFVVRDKNK
jgi:hypothetical protein